MDSKSAIFVPVGSLLVMATHSSFTNFISAAPEVTLYACNKQKTGCYVEFADGSKMMCSYNSSTQKWDCTPIRNTGSDIPTKLKNAIDTAREEVLSNTTDSKDLGGMQTDKGITKIPVE